MNEKTLEVLVNLAAKLGTTSEYLWGVLLRQAPIVGFTNLLISAAWIGVTIFVWRVMLRKTSCPPATEDNCYPRAEWREEVAVMLWGITGMLSVVAAIFVMDSFEIMVVAFANPEYWALKQILR